MKIKLKGSARDDLLAIRDWSEAKWGEDRASDYLRKLHDAIAGLAENPYLGRPRPALMRNLRSLVSQNYLILYAVVADSIDVLAVIHEKRNLAALDFADRFDSDEMP